MHAIVGGFTSDNTYSLMMNPHFYFVLAMEVIVCTAGVGIALRTSKCTGPTVVEPKLLSSVLEFAMMIALSSKLFMEH